MSIMSEFAFGVGLNILGSLCINLGTNVVKYAHVESENQEKESNRIKEKDAAVENGKPRSEQQNIEENIALDDTSENSSVSDEGCKPPFKEKFENTPKSFYLGWGLFIFGNGLNFASFSFAPQSVLAALGSVQFVANVFFGAAVLKQPITWRIAFATLAIVLGNVLLVVASNKDTQEFDSKQLLSAWQNVAWLVYVAVIVVGSIILHIYYRHLLQLTNPVHRLMLTHLASMSEDEITQRMSVGVHSRLSMTYQEQVNNDELENLSAHDPEADQQEQPIKSYSKLIPFSYAAVSGMIGSQSVMLAKSASILFRNTIQGNNQFTYFFTYVIFFLWGVTIVFWLYRMNNALKMFEGVFIIPALQVIWIFFSVLGGGIYFQEFNDLEVWQYLVFVLGMLIIFAGVYGLAPDKPSPEQVRRATSMHRSSISRTQVFNLNEDDAFRSSMSQLSRTLSRASSYSAFLAQPVLKPGQKRSSKNIGASLHRNGSLLSHTSSKRNNGETYYPVFREGSISHSMDTSRRRLQQEIQNTRDMDTDTHARPLSPSPPAMGGMRHSDASTRSPSVTSPTGTPPTYTRAQSLPQPKISDRVRGSMGKRRSLTPTAEQENASWRYEIANPEKNTAESPMNSQKTRENSSSESENSMFGKSVTSGSATSASVDSPRSDASVRSGMRNMLFRTRNSLADMLMLGSSSTVPMGYDIKKDNGSGSNRDRTTSEMDLVVGPKDLEAFSGISRSL